MVSLLVNSPRVRVLSEAGQPLSVQISVHWSSATNLVPDVYQVRQGSALPAHQYLSWASLPTNTRFLFLRCALLAPQDGGRWLGERHFPEDSHSWDLSILDGEDTVVMIIAQTAATVPSAAQHVFVYFVVMGSCMLPKLVS